MTSTALDWIGIGPALVVLFAGLAAVGIDLFFKPGASRMPLVVLSLAALGVSAAWLTNRLWAGKRAIEAFGGALVLDDLACFLGLAIIGATALMLISAEVDTRRRQIAFGEYYGLLMVSSSAMMMLVASNDFLMVFLNLEILSLALYVLTGITRRNPRANEAAVKYLVTGAFATCFLLMGVALIYGATGSIELDTIGTWLARGGDSPLLHVGVGLVLVGFAFKIGAAPFHMWVPDVYEGAPTTTTAFMSVTVKAAGVGALVRVLLVALPTRSDLWADLLWWMAVLTMVVGNLLAIRQSSVKRMLAFSSIAHTGYALVALATLRGTDGTFSTAGAGAALFYLMTYTFMTLGAFVVLVYLGHEVARPAPAVVARVVDPSGQPVELLDRQPEWQDAETFGDLAGAARRHPWAALAMTIFAISLGGLPPTAGFVGKFAVFAAAVAQGHVGIVILGVFASLVSLYYYLRLVVAMYMLEPLANDERTDRSVGAVVALAAVATMAIGILPGILYDWAVRSIVLLQG